MNAGNRQTLATRFVSQTLEAITGAKMPPVALASRIDSALSHADNHHLPLDGLIHAGAAYLGRNADRIGAQALNVVERMSQLYGTGDLETLRGNSPSFMCREFVLLANRTAVFYGESYASSIVVSPRLGAVRADSINELDNPDDQFHLAQINTQGMNAYTERRAGMTFQQRLSVRAATSQAISSFT